MKADEPDAAEREIRALIQDLEADRTPQAKRRTILERSRTLLTSLQR